MGATGWYAARRLAIAGPTVLGLSFLVFVMSSFAGDPSAKLAERGLEPGEVPTQEQIAAVHHQLGLDRPLLVRYGEWLGRAIHGDLGESLVIPGQSVGDAIRRAVPATVSLGLAALVVVIALSVPLGTLGALAPGRWWAQFSRVAALGGASIPGFFLAYILIYLFAVQWHVFPVVGHGGLDSIVLPAVTLALAPAALVSRLLQRALVEQLGDDYARTARAKGLSRAGVVVMHAMRNAWVPVVTVLGYVLVRLLEGAIVVELIFGRSGIGNLTLRAVGSADYPMIQGVVLFAGVVVIAFNLAVDVIYPALDPRVRLGVAA